MREYGKLEPTFWTRGSGKKLRGDVEAQLVAAYLFSSPNSNMVGIFYLPVVLIAHHTGLSLEGARKGLARICEEQIAHYDEASELVFVVRMVHRGVGPTLKAKDKRIKGIEKELDQVGKHWFAKEFLNLYREAYRLRARADLEGLERPSDAPSKPEQSRAEQSRAEDAAPKQPPQRADLGEPEAEFFAELKRHDSLATVANRPCAKGLAERFATNQIARGTRLEWAIEAIRECAADVAGLGLSAEALTRKLRSYVDHAKAPKAPTSPSGVIAVAEPEVDRLNRELRERERKAV